MQAEHGTGESSKASLTAAERSSLLQVLPDDILGPVKAATDKAAGADALVSLHLSSILEMRDPVGPSQADSMPTF